ncbi:DUF3037 domain-containing protein [Bosea sp. FBZP-16]|uniref:DUF3037 domain-containing protein n=1 Tax=Bosea sp. FBZP-16 TaxID=2065382 RepID=UPI000C301400|nr:DUF3037 domain-containing protein [Bosea sp. FBZP-16]
MARSYNFAVIRLAPNDTRDERVNVGIAIVTDDGLDVRVSRKMDKVRAISNAIDAGALRDLVLSMREVDAQLQLAGLKSPNERLEHLNRIGPLMLSTSGAFMAETMEAYERRIESIMTAMVEPEKAPTRVREKRTRLLTQMKKVFRQERILAQRGEGLGSHRIVPGVEMEEGLVADLVLKNGKFHVVETVDASAEAETPRKALSDIGISALVLERARMKFGSNISTRLVYVASPSVERIAIPCLEAASHQGAELVNWASQSDRRKFVADFASMADPIPKKNSGRQQPVQIRFQ